MQFVGSEFFSSEIGIYNIDTKQYEVIKDDTILPSEEYIKNKGTPMNLTIKSFSDRYLVFSNGGFSSTVVYDRKNKNYIDPVKPADKQEYLTSNVGVAYDNLAAVWLWKNEYSRFRIYVLEK